MFSKTESLSSDDDDNDTNTNTNNEDVLKPPLQLSMEDLDIDMDELSHLLLQQTDDDDKEASVTSTTRRTTKSTELWLDLRGTGRHNVYVCTSCLKDWIDWIPVFSIVGLLINNELFLFAAF